MGWNEFVVDVRGLQRLKFANGMELSKRERGSVLVYLYPPILSPCFVFSCFFSAKKGTSGSKKGTSGSGQHGRTKNRLRRKTKFQTHSSENLWVTSGRSEYFWWGLHRGYNFYLNRHFRDFSDPNNCETLTVHKAIMAAKSPNREHNDNTQSHHENKPWRTAPTQ